MGKIDIEVTAEQFESLSEEVQGFYTKNGEGYVLDGVHGMKTALAKEKERSQAFAGLNPDEAKAAIAKASEIDFDIAEAKKALQLATELEQKKLVDAGEFDKAKEKIETEYQQKLQQANSSKSALLGKFGKITLENTLEAKGIRPELKDLVATQLLTESLEIAEKDGEIVFNNQGIGDSADIDKIIDGLKESRASLFTSSQLPGSGANGNGNGTGVKAKWSDLSKQDQIAAIREHGSRAEAMKNYQ